MAQYDVDVRIMPRPTLLDPQGQAVQHALAALGFADVADVRVGKSLTLRVDCPDADRAAQDARDMCEKLLANPVTEDFEVSVEEVRS